MIRRVTPALALAFLCPLVGAHAQLPMITVPHGALQISLVGAFYPNDHVWVNGTRQPLGAMIGTGTMTANLQTSLAQVLGEPVSGLSTGGVTSIADREHGVGDITLGYGLTSRISVFGTIPIVYVRSRAAATGEPGVSRVGINPANSVAGTPAGQEQTTNFFTQFDAALTTLSSNLQNGSYAGDPSLQAAAQQALSSATAMRGSLFTLLADPAQASTLLPLESDVYGATLLAQITTLQQNLGSQFGVTGFTAEPALPTAPFTDSAFAALISAPGGFGFSSPNLKPRYGVGDIEAGVAVQLIAADSVGADAWHDVWLRGTVRLPTGAPADPTLLLDQATGSASPAFRVDGIAEIGRRRLGLRGVLSYQHALAAAVSERISALDQLLVPAANISPLQVQPGDSLSITAQPFVAFAPHLALTALVQYWRTGSSHTGVAGAPTGSDLVPALLDRNSAADAIVVGLGLSYSHPGRDGPGGDGLPVEASWSIERTVHSGGGIFPDNLTSRLSLKFYRPIVRH